MGAERLRRSVCATLAIVVIASSCGSDFNDANDANDANGSSSDTGGTATDAPSNDIGGHVKEWEVEVDAESATAGEITFTIDNDGTIGHEFLVVKTDIAPGEIPVDGDHFPEDASGIEVIDEIGEFDKETTEQLVVTLEPGNYQLVCNLPDHYANGMHTGFQVTA